MSLSIIEKRYQTFPFVLAVGTYKRDFVKSHNSLRQNRNIIK